MGFKATPTARLAAVCMIAGIGSVALSASMPARVGAAIAPAGCVATSPDKTEILTQGSACQYTATATQGSYAAATPYWWQINVTSLTGGTTIAATGGPGSTNAAGTFAETPGDVVTVFLFGDCLANAACGTSGTVSAADVG